jgi:hypothetical protein
MKELTDLMDVVIFMENDGSYNLFSKYIITKLNNEFRVTTSNTDLDLRFSTLQNATAWCIFHKQNKIVDANRIYELDIKLGGINVELMNHSRLYKKAKTQPDQLIYVAKLTEDRFKKRNILSELQIFTRASKTWQNKRYALSH